MVIITVWILTNFLAGDANDMAVANARTGISARGGVGGACFAPGNKVYKRDDANSVNAEWVNIEDLRRGDYVATDAKNGSWEWTQVFYARIYPGPHVVSHFDHAGNKFVRVTEDHLVSSEGKLVHARELLATNPESGASDKTVLQSISARCPSDGNWVNQQQAAPASVRFKSSLRFHSTRFQVICACLVNCLSFKLELRLYVVITALFICPCCQPQDAHKLF